MKSITVLIVRWIMNMMWKPLNSYLTRASKTRDNTKRIEWYQKAVDLVHGPYLKLRWMQPGRLKRRERLGQMYVSALGGTGSVCIWMPTKLDRCLSICQLGAGPESCTMKKSIRWKCVLYAALGDRGSIVRRYQASKSALEEGLGIPPSQETESLYRDFNGLTGNYRLLIALMIFELIFQKAISFISFKL